MSDSKQHYYYNDIIDVLFEVKEPYRLRFIALISTWANKPEWANGSPPERHELVDWLKCRPLKRLLLTCLLRAWTHDERL